MLNFILNKYSAYGLINSGFCVSNFTFLKGGTLYNKVQNIVYSYYRKKLLDAFIYL